MILKLRGYVMAFFGLFKKKEEKPIEEVLDVPPLPPMGAEFEKELPSIEEELPGPPTLGEIELGKTEPLPLPPEEAMEGELPELPKLETYEAEFKPEEPIPYTKPGLEEFEEKATQEETRKLKTIPEAPVFVRVDLFKDVLVDFAHCKSLLKTVEDSWQEIEDIGLSQERSYADWQHALGDMQRKLLFIDRTLFKTR